jgi:hypothetical protein
MMRPIGINQFRFQVLNRVNDEDGFDIGTLPILPPSTLKRLQRDPTCRLPDDGGTPCLIKESLFSTGGLVWGAAGFGKSYFLKILADEWVSTHQGRARLRLIDPKGELFQLFAAAAAWTYIFLERAPDVQELFARSFYVNDVLKHALTPPNLYAVPEGMAPEVLAQARAATTVHAFGGDWSELMEYGVELLFRVVIDLGTVGITTELVRALLFDRVFRETVLAPRVSSGLRASVLGIEATLPEMTRQAILRRFTILLGSRAARVIYGLSPTACRSLLPEAADADDEPLLAQQRLENFGPSLLRPPNVAIAMAMNATVDGISQVMIRNEVNPDLFILEEAAQLVHNATVARYVLDASRTLRWKGVSLVTCAQDPTNAFPREVIRTLALNSRWYAAFQCAKEDAALIEPSLSGYADVLRMNFALSGRSPDRQDAIQRMLSLPRQHFILLLKDEAPFIVRTRDVENPMKSTGMSREDLLAVFYDSIGRFSMVEISAAEEFIEEETRALFGGAAMPAAPAAQPGPSLTVDDLFREIEAGRARQSAEVAQTEEA